METVLVNDLYFDRNRKFSERRFCSMFGISYYIANILMSKMSGPVVPIYLLLTLHFLKNYFTECVINNIFDLEKNYS